MTDSPLVAAVIPVLDHAATVAGVVRDAAAHVPTVIVVDDGSTDGSCEAAEAARGDLPDGAALHVIGQPHDGGRGAALLAAFAKARELGATHALTLEGDGRHPTTDIPRFLDRLAADAGSILIGRHETDSGSRKTDFWVLRATGIEGVATACGLRLYPLAALTELPLRCTGEDFDAEVLVRAAWNGTGLANVSLTGPATAVATRRSWGARMRLLWTFARLTAVRLVPTKAAMREIVGKDRPKIRLRDTWARLKELNARGKRPAELALAVGIGVLVGASPLWGVHGWLALYIGVRLHLNLVAAFIGSNVSIPFIAPFLVFASLQCGHLMLLGRWLDLRPESTDEAMAWETPIYYIVGTLPVALVLAVVAATVTLFAARSLRRRKERA